jgi:hypothetical protein
VDFHILDLLDEQARCDFLVDALHAEGLRCRGSRHASQRSRRDQVFEYRRADSGRVFNVWTGTLLQAPSAPPPTSLWLCGA